MGINVQAEPPLSHHGSSWHGTAVQGAKVQGAKVQGAKVQGAKVQGAKVQGAQVQETWENGISSHENACAEVRNTLNVSSALKK